MQDLKKLIARYLNRTASSAEINFIEKYDDYLELQQGLSSLLSETENLQIEQRNWEELTAQIDRPSTVIVPHRVHFLRKWRWAAALILLIAGAIIWRGKFALQHEKIAKEKKAEDLDIAPGGDKAVLTLSDGTTIALDSTVNGTIAQQGNASIVKLDNGAIRYDLKGISKGTVLMNTMTTPKGGQYRLTLPDGTKLWLNAASSVQYPAVFVGKERRINVSGEVYLEVARDKSKPFIVDVEGRSSVEVLGTSFNVNAYTDESVVKTTLIEGSVRVSKNNTSTTVKSVVLTPGQQAQINGSIVVASNINPDQVIAWKNGLFNFEGMPLRSVMKQLERWYDIKVEYKENIQDIVFKGELFRNMKLNEVLYIFEKIGLQFEMHGRILIVTNI